MQTLRFIKYAAGKGGSDFKREMQRQAGVVKALFHYKGQLDALKGDALNKAVRDMAHEAVAAIFGTEEMTSRMEDVGKRIQGFGSSNYDSRPREEDKKSMLTGLVGFGSQTIKQSLEMIQNYNHYSGSGSGPGSGNNRTSFTGTYRTQGLRRSLTAERDKPFQKEEKEWNVRDAEAEAGVQTSSSKDNASFKSEVSNGSGNYEDGRTDTTVESRLLDSLTVPGGIRLNPTRETIQAFTTTAQNLDAAHLVNSLEIKLKAHNWQVFVSTVPFLQTASAGAMKTKHSLVLFLFRLLMSIPNPHLDCMVSFTSVAEVTRCKSFLSHSHGSGEQQVTTNNPSSWSQQCACKTHTYKKWGQEDLTVN